MDSYHLRIYGFIEATKIRVEGMKAENLRRALNNESPAWSQEAFDHEAAQIESLVRDLS